MVWGVACEVWYQTVLGERPGVQNTCVASALLLNFLQSGFHPQRVGNTTFFAGVHKTCSDSAIYLAQ